MALPTPNLDDRRFQDLVDDAKRMVQRRCPEWTDHNVHDPGVTLIEVFASMTDQLLFRLNRVPERNYVRFLDLLGVRLYPPTAAQAGVTFWLSAPQPEPITIPANTSVTTLRTDSDEAVGFTTTEDLVIPPCSLERVRSQIDSEGTRDHARSLADGQEFRCFDEVPNAGDLLLLGLSTAVPCCALAVRLDCRIEGVGVDPEDPPLIWEAWTGDGWTPCEVDRDETGGLNRGGDIVLHVPPGHAVSVIDGQRAGWVRARVLAAEEGQPAYSDSPRISRVEAFTIGGTARAVNAEDVTDEIVGFSELVAGQRFALLSAAGAASRRARCAGDQRRRRLATLGAGRGLRRQRTRRSALRARPHRRRDRPGTSGAPRGRLARAVRAGAADGQPTPRQALPHRRRRAWQRRARHRHPPASADPLRRPHREPPRRNRWSRRGDRRERQAPRALAAAHAQPRSDAGGLHDLGQGGGARRRRGCMPWQRAKVPTPVRCGCWWCRTWSTPKVAWPSSSLVPTDEMLGRIAGHLDERRTIGARVVVEPPTYQGITVVARVRARTTVLPAALQKSCLAALFEYFHPVRGGPDGTGWPFGRPAPRGRGLRRAAAARRRRADRGRAALPRRSHHRRAG